jgi:hypothetical protein
VQCDPWIAWSRQSEWTRLPRRSGGTGRVSARRFCRWDTAIPAGVIRTAEFIANKHGKIVEIRLIFDATALRRLMLR